MLNVEPFETDTPFSPDGDIGYCIRLQQQRLMRLLRRYVSEEDAEDAMQRVWLKLSYKGGCPWEWLAKVARHQALDLIRTQKREAARRRAVAETAKDTVQPDENVWDEVLPAIDALPPNERTAIVERFIKGRRVEEIAELTGVKRVTVYQRIDRGVKALRARLAE